MGAGVIQQAPPLPPGLSFTPPQGTAPPLPPGLSATPPASRQQRPSQPRPQAAPQAAPFTADIPGPPSIEAPLTYEERLSAAMDQGYSADAAIKKVQEDIAYETANDPGNAPAQPEVLNQHVPENVYSTAGLAPSGPGYSGPGSSYDNPFVLREVVPGSEEDFAQRRAAINLSQGMFVQQPDGSIGRLTGDAYTDENAPDQGMGGVTTRERNLADQLRAFSMGAAEQVPFLDEAAVGAAGLISGRGYSDVRDSYQAAQAIDNQTNRGQRVAGGLTGFGATLLAPGIGGSKFIAGGSGLGQQMARAAAVGAGTGGVYGAGAAEGGLEERARAGALGALVGAGTGGTVRGAAPVVGDLLRRGASGVAEASAVVGRGFGRVADDAPITPEATQSAQQYLARLLETSGADLSANPTAALGKPITAAEAIGPSGIANMAALTRRSGRAGNMAQSQLGARAVEQPNRVVQDFADLTGMDPAGSADMVQNLATAGRARAAPLYEAAYARPGAVRSPLIDDLLSRPASRDAMRRAVKIAANEGRDPNTLGFQFDEAGDVIHVQEPSMETLDYVKRGLDDVLNTYRDSTTRRLNLDGEGRSVVGIATQLRDELVRLNPAYGEALSAGGDPIRLEEAFRLSDRLFQVGTPERTFRVATERMGEAERNALVAGFADRLFRDAQAGRLNTRQLNQLNVPVTREKLASLIGAEGAESFMQRIAAEIELARSGGRMAPGTNSVTAEALAAMAEQDGSTGFTADLARNMAAGRGALTLTLGKAAVAPMTGFVRGATVAKPQAVRDEIARLLLLSPEELQAELTAVAGSARPEPGTIATGLQATAGPASGRFGAQVSQSESGSARPESRRAQR